MSELQDIEHKLDKADDDLTALTADVVKLKADNAEMRAALSEILQALSAVQTVTDDSHLFRAQPDKRAAFIKLNEIVSRLTPKFPQ